METYPMADRGTPTQGFLTSWPQSDMDSRTRSGVCATRTGVLQPGRAADLELAYNDVLGWLNICEHSLLPPKGIFNSVEPMKSCPAAEEALAGEVVFGKPEVAGEYAIEVCSSSSDLFNRLRRIFESERMVEVLQVNTEAMTCSVVFCEELTAVDVQSRICCAGENGPAKVVLSHLSKRDVVRFRRCVERIQKALLLEPGAIIDSNVAKPRSAIDVGFNDASFFGGFDDFDSDDVDWTAELNPLLDQACSANEVVREDVAQQLALMLRANPQSRLCLADLVAQRPEVLDSLFSKSMGNTVIALSTMHCAATMLLLASTAETMSVETAHKLRSITASILLVGTAKIVEQDLAQVLQNLRVQ